MIGQRKPGQPAACGCAGERRLHSCVPFLLGAGALILMAFFLGSDPPAAFLSLLGATIIWGPAGVIYGLPATFLQACMPPVLDCAPLVAKLHSMH
jgi:hypothetical protein